MLEHCFHLWAGSEQNLKTVYYSKILISRLYTVSLSCNFTLRDVTFYLFILHAVSR